MHWFRKAQYAVALVVIPLTGIGFATQIGDHSAQYIVLVYLMGGVQIRMKSEAVRFLSDSCPKTTASTAV